MKIMTETKMHSFLKDVGMAWLYNQGCFLVGTEVCVASLGCRIDHPLDRHWIIDVCGVGEKYIPYEQRPKNGPLWDPEGSPKYKYNILRGLEVKVSRNDFKNGFVCSGCNYNYLMVQKGLIDVSEVPKGVGVIEVDVANFRAGFHSIYRFSFCGAKVVRRPKFKELKQYQIDNAISSIGKRSTRELILRIAEKLQKRVDNKVY